MNIIFTLLILSLACISIRYIWVNDIDYLEWAKSKAPKVPLKKTAPTIEYGITPLLTHYSIGQKIDDVTWRYNYSNYLLTIVNNSSEDVSNTIISISLPAGIVKNKIESNVNVFNINISSFNQPITLGKNKIDDTFSNNIDISIEKLNKHSTLTIGLILDYRNKPKEWWNSDQGYWLFDISYEYESKKDTKTRIRFINPVKIITEEPLSLYIDKEINYVNQDNIKCTQDTYPFSPIISKPNRSFMPLEGFNGVFKDIKLGKGEGLMNSIGMDYTVNTDTNYK